MEKKELACEKAAEYFRRGFNCSQSVLKASSEVLGLAIPPEIINAAAGFSGGIGYSGCVCGALTGAVMLIGLSRANKGVSKKSALLYRWFEQEFSSPCCASIREERPFSNKEVRKLCTEVTAKTARKVVEVLIEG